MYNILEVANCHGGSKEYILELIKKFEEFNKEKKFGMKFQPFKYDEIAKKDYEWYSVYENLYFSSKEWREIINIAFQTKDIWLDIFDNYSLQILEENIDKIRGIKFQTSVLDNLLLFERLKKINLKNLEIILNIAGRELYEIIEILNRYKKLNFKKIYLEIGFQGYPTDFKDSGLNKIKILKKNISNIELVFADHTSVELNEAFYLPIIAKFLGCSIIEKHIMLEKEKTKYDYFSSFTYKQYKEFISEQLKYFSLEKDEFITEKEKKYLNNTLQIPILKKDKKAGELIDLKNDIIYQRTSEKGLNIKELESLVEQKYILIKDKKVGQTFKLEDMKKATIAVIVACRLKSSRLKRKALLKIGNLTSIELCLKNISKFRDINAIVLATSTNEEDFELKNYTYNDAVIFHQGDPNDVIQRYLDIINLKNYDIIVRVTGDCPYLSKDICEIVLNSHFKEGAEYSNGIGAAVGTNVEIINSNALRKVKKFFPKAEYSEYMTWYFQNNPEYFKLNFVELPKQLKRDYRLTLDYEKDLEMFNIIENYFEKNNLEYNIFELFKFLDENRNIANINLDIPLVYKSDVELIEKLNKFTKIGYFQNE